MKRISGFIWLVIIVLAGIAIAPIEVFLRALSPFLVLFGTGKVKQYGLNVLEGHDNSVSAQFGGDPDESLSSRLGKARLRGSGWSIVADKVDLAAELLGDKNHCNKSIERDEGKKQVTHY